MNAASTVTTPDARHCPLRILGNYGRYLPLQMLVFGTIWHAAQSASMHWNPFNIAWIALVLRSISTPIWYPVYVHGRRALPEARAPHVNLRALSRDQVWGQMKPFSASGPRRGGAISWKNIRAPMGALENAF